MWCRPEPSSVSPIYMPGRLRTASRPLRTLMDSAPYSGVAPGVVSGVSVMEFRCQRQLSRPGGRGAESRADACLRYRLPRLIFQALAGICGGLAACGRGRFGTAANLARFAAEGRSLVPSRLE